MRLSQSASHEQSQRQCKSSSIKESKKKQVPWWKWRSPQKTCSKDRTPEGQELDYLLEIVESLGYEVQYDKRERFFHINLQQVENFRFGFHFVFEHGRLELIWVIYEGDKVIMGSPFEMANF